MWLLLLYGPSTAWQRRVGLPSDGKTLERSFFAKITQLQVSSNCLTTVYVFSESIQAT